MQKRTERLVMRRREKGDAAEDGEAGDEED